MQSFFSNLPWQIIFGLDGAHVNTTIVGGRVLMRDRKLLTLDEERIAAQALEYAPKLLEYDPRDYFALMVLRDADLAGANPELARARYAKAYPELLATKSPDSRQLELACCNRSRARPADDWGS